MPYPTYEERVAFGKLPKEERQELFEKMTPEERSNISGYGSEDNPGYCDMNGHCYSYEEDAECADSYIKEIRDCKEETDRYMKGNKKLIAENKILKEEVQNIENRVIQTRIEKVELEGLLGEMDELWEKDKKKVIELRKEVEHWKNFALVYWSGNQLGKGEPCGCYVWQEALDEVNSNDDYDLYGLTKKCMHCDSNY